jgi:SAM-dependent methyltransferase
VVITKPDLGNGVSHPARYSKALIPVFAELLGAPCDVLDPMAGVGGVHALQQYGHRTVGVELEAEWAALNRHTLQGNALALPFKDETFDAILVSPCYGNRLADRHNAKDASVRRSYTHDLGRPLSADNSGGMQWGSEYRDFHCFAWEEASRVLKYGGRFILNVSDHIRAGKRQNVSGWHVNCLAAYCQLAFIDLVAVPTPRLRQGSNAAARVNAEYVFVFSK